MKKYLLFAICIFSLLNSNAQGVTQINGNKNLQPVTVINSTTAIFESGLDSSIWISDGTLAGTIQISDTIKYAGDATLLNGKCIFTGWSPNCGKEIFITDGTKSGTKIIRDIVPGTESSLPFSTTMEVFNNFVYFFAVTPAEGCELWRTDGTAGNTAIVKDIVAGAGSGIDSSSFYITSSGSYLIFQVNTAAAGHELWSSGGTAATTNLLKDITAGAPSSYPRAFFPLNNFFLFTVNSPDSTTTQIWRTDGTPAGTILIKDQIVTAFGMANFSFNLFHVFKGRAYFLIDDGVHPGDALWSTDGVDATAAHTSFVKDLGTKTFSGSFLLLDAINLADKFIFPFSDGTTVFSLQQSDGTLAGTKSFKDFPANTEGNVPVIYINAIFDNATNTIKYPLYNGKFFFSASDANGNELWMSDGTTTQLVKDINPGISDGITNFGNWLFTTSGLFFAADDGIHGNELWRTDGTTTSMVADIFLNTHHSNPQLYFVNNGKIFFSATDGNPADSTIRDLYVVNGTFTPLPVKLLNFTAVSNGNDALLQWATAQEVNSKNFTVQSSSDGQHWKNIGTVAAKGNSSVKNDYSFIDEGVVNSGNDVIYYKLISTDIDGSSQSSDVISLRIRNAENLNVRLFSNPIQDRLKILITGTDGYASLSVHELSGKRVFSQQVLKSEDWISVPINLRAGVYILRITTKGQAKSIKFIKE